MPVAAAARNALKEIEKLKKKGRALSPVVIEGRKIAKSFWGKAWCDNLERYSDYANRLPRGRTYVNNGSVIDLQIERGKVEALVSGSEIYKVKIDIAVAAPARWKAICADCAGSVGSIVELLQGKLSKHVMERVCREADGLFPDAAKRSRCPAPARTGRACASMLRRRSMASARGSTAIPTCCSRCAASTAASWSHVGADLLDHAKPRRRATACLPTTISRLCSGSTWPSRRRRGGTPPAAAGALAVADQAQPRAKPAQVAASAKAKTKDSPLSRQASPKRIESRGARRSPPRRAAPEGQRKQNRLLTSLQSTACRLPGRSRRRSSKATPTLSASGVAPGLHNRVARERPSGSAHGPAGRECDNQRPRSVESGAPEVDAVVEQRGVRLPIVIVTRRTDCLAGVSRGGRMHVIAGNGPSADDRRQMHSDSRAPAHEVLAGLVERVTFHNEDNGFCVLRMKARGQRDLVTVVGQAATISAGEWITASGEWANDRTHGLQFRARFLKTSAPTSDRGDREIPRFRHGPRHRPGLREEARRGVRRQGVRHHRGRADAAAGGHRHRPVRAKRITDAWAEQKIMREIMVFLHSTASARRAR